MPISLADANLPIMTTEGFFNEFESDVLAVVTAGGSGFYKLSHAKDNGNFTSATKVTEADDAATLNDLSDRFIQVGEFEDYQYVNFVI